MAHKIEIPEELLIRTTGHKIEALVHYTYPDFQTKVSAAKLSQREGYTGNYK